MLRTPRKSSDISPSNFVSTARTTYATDAHTREPIKKYGNDNMVSMYCAPKSMHTDEMHRTQRQMLLSHRKR